MRVRYLLLLAVGFVATLGWARVAAAFDPALDKYTSGEVSPVQSCFYECKQAQRATISQPTVVLDGTILEDTLLMLVNESPTENLLSFVMLLDGHQAPQLVFMTRLSPLDLDEINICRTFERRGLVPPQAGVIEILTVDAVTNQPEGGVYAWIKDLAAKNADKWKRPALPVLTLRRQVADDPNLRSRTPGVSELTELKVVTKFHSHVTGVGKTECRTTPPEVYGGASGLLNLLTLMQQPSTMKAGPIYAQRTGEFPAPGPLGPEVCTESGVPCSTDPALPVQCPGSGADLCNPE